MNIAAGPGGLWFSEGSYERFGRDGTNRIGHISTRGTEAVPRLGRVGTGAITAGPEGDLWFINRAIAASRVEGPAAGLEQLDGLEASLGDHHRLHAARAHLLEEAGEAGGAVAAYERAAELTRSVPERNYLTKRAAKLRASA